MKTIIYQNQIWEEHGYEQFMEGLSLGFVMEKVDIIPFTITLSPETEAAPDFVFGSGRMVDIARQRGWHTFESFEPNQVGILDDKSLWLNSDVKKMKIKDLDIDFFETVFIKPLREKLFTGKVFEGIALRDNEFDSLVQCSTTDVEDLQEEYVFVSPVQFFDIEYRFFVFNNQIATGSTYGGLNEHHEMQSKGTSRVLEMTQEMIDKHFVRNITGVVDVTLMDNGKLYIVELNNMNSAGVYASCPIEIKSALLKL
jgi:hypothetical protein